MTNGFLTLHFLQMIITSNTVIMSSFHVSLIIILFFFRANIEAKLSDIEDALDAISFDKIGSSSRSTYLEVIFQGR